MESTLIELSSGDLEPNESNYEDLQNFPVIAEAISYDEFFNKYILSNVPCLLRVPGLVQTWKSFSDWSKEGECNLEFFREHLSPELQVPVSNCDVKFFNSQEKIDMTIQEYLQYWKTQRESGEKKYLKDWHFRRDCPNYSAYRTPKYFSSDWLNEYWDDQNLGDDYKFVYIGPKGSWTPLHCDVFGSYSWSANIVGCKRWLFFPPGQEKLLIKKGTSELIYNVNEILRLPQNHLKSTKFELCSTTLGEDRVVKFFEVFQKSGEIIFVPSGWHHQVENCEDTISINHNWFNGANMSNYIWDNLELANKAVEEEISDCKKTATEPEWHTMCQNLLKASHGMNYADVYNLLQVVAKKRIFQLKSGQDSKPFDGWHLGLNHAIFDLKQIHFLLEKLKNVPCLFPESESIIKFQEKIEFVISNSDIL